MHWWPIGTRCCLLAAAVPTTKAFQINTYFVDDFGHFCRQHCFACNLPLCFRTILFNNKSLKGFSAQWNYERVPGKTCHLVDFPFNMCQVPLRQIARVRYFLLKFMWCRQLLLMMRRGAVISKDCHRHICLHHDVSDCLSMWKYLHYVNLFWLFDT